MDTDQHAELEIEKAKEKVAMQRKINTLQSQLAKSNNENFAMQSEFESKIKNLQTDLAKSKNIIKILKKNWERQNKTIREFTEPGVGDTCEIPENEYVEVRDITRPPAQMHTERNAKHGRSSARPNEPPPKPPIPDRRRTRPVLTNTYTTDLPKDSPSAMIAREQARSNTFLKMPSRALPHGPEPSLGDHHRRLQPQDDLNASTTPGSTSDEDITAPSVSTYATYAFGDI